MMYYCATYDEVTLACEQWVEYSVLGLPPLSVQEANTLIGEVVALWALALGIAVLVRTVAQRKL